jgi:hypothetical protein
MRNLLMLFCLVAGLVACKSKSPAESPKSSGQTTQAEMDALPMLVVSFYSIAYGIDSGARAALDAYLSKHEQILKVEKKPWGREGEVDYCLFAPTLTEAQKAEHVQAIRALLSTGKNLHLYTDKACRESPQNQNE